MIAETYSKDKAGVHEIDDLARIMRKFADAMTGVPSGGP